MLERNSTWLAACWQICGALALIAGDSPGFCSIAFLHAASAAADGDCEVLGWLLDDGARELDEVDGEPGAPLAGGIEPPDVLDVLDLVAGEPVVGDVPVVVRGPVEVEPVVELPTCELPALADVLELVLFDPPQPSSGNAAMQDAIRSEVAERIMISGVWPFLRVLSF